LTNNLLAFVPYWRYSSFAFSGKKSIVFGQGLMSVTKTTKCPRCFGAGRDAAGKTCSLCKGAGEVTQKPGSKSLSRIQPRRDDLNGASRPGEIS